MWTNNQIDIQSFADKKNIVRVKNHTFFFACQIENKKV